MPYQLREGFRGVTKALVDLAETPERKRLARKTEAIFDEDRATRKLREQAAETQQKGERVYKLGQRSSAEEAAGMAERGEMLDKGGKSLSGKFVGAALRGGASYSEIGTLQNKLIPKPKEPKDFADTSRIKYAEDMSIKFMTDMGSSLDNADLNDPDSMDKSANMMDAYKGQMELIKESFIEKKPEYAIELSKMKDEVVASMNQRTLDATEFVLKKQLGNMDSGEINKFIDMFDSHEHEFAKSGLDLSGMPSTLTIQQFGMLLKATGMGKKDELTQLKGARDPKLLREIVEDGEAGDPVRMYAFILLKNSFSADIIKASREYKKSKKSRSYFNLSPGLTKEDVDAAIKSSNVKNPKDLSLKPSSPLPGKRMPEKRMRLGEGLIVKP